MCGAEVALWEETVGFLCWGQPWPASCGSFNILQFKYGVLESGLFSEFFKEEGTYGQIDGLSLSQTPIPHLDLFRKGLFCVWKWHLVLDAVFFCVWCFLKFLAETCSSRNLIQFFEVP